MINLGLIVVKGTRSVSMFVFCQCHLLKRLSNCLWSVVKEQLTIFMWVYFWALGSVPLLYLSIRSPVPSPLDSCRFTASVEHA